MKIIENVLGIKNENKMISLEYFIGILLAFSLWGYQLINAGIISQDLFKKCKIYLIFRF
jgi:hypothetical protein